MKTVFTSTNKNLSYYLCRNFIPQYDDPERTLVEAKMLFQNTHNLLQGDKHSMKKIKHGSILGEAYYRAALVKIEQDGGTIEKFFSIPTAHQFFDELKKLIKEYEEEGYNFNGSDLVETLFSHDENKEE